MKLHFCTLFNSAYLARGLAMYDSLKNVAKDFHLYVFAFDEDTHQFFIEGNYPNITIVSLKEFEDPELLRVKTDRTAGEYCWTCTSSTILYCIENFALDHCTYIDADMIFYSDPVVHLHEMANSSVLITEHRYTTGYDQSLTSGIYCVQYVTFRNDERGMKALRWWREACIEWCYNRFEDGKFGDQKYLDDWTTRFDGVHVLQNEGGGLAPWNVQQYNISMNDKAPVITNKSTGQKFEVVFFHYHGVKFYGDDQVEFTGAGYSLSKEVRNLLYKPYAKRLFQYGDEIIRSGKIRNPNGASKESRPSRTANAILILKHNAMGLLRFILKRTSQFRRFENQLYSRSDL